MYLLCSVSEIYALTNRHGRSALVYAFQHAGQLSKIDQLLRDIFSNPKSYFGYGSVRSVRVNTFQMEPSRCQIRSLDLLPFSAVQASRGVASTSRSIKECSPVQFPWG